MLDCVRRRSGGQSVTPGGSRPALRSLVLALPALGALAWLVADNLWAQGPPPASPPPTAPTPTFTTLTPQTPDVTGTPPPPAPLNAMPVQRPVAFLGGAVRRFQFTIDSNLPLKELLPTPPVVKKVSGPAAIQNLGDVPEVDFQALLAKGLAREEAMKQTAHMIAKANHLNGKKTDGFLEALIGARPDLTGLPFAMGDACRIKGDRSRLFTRAVATVRSALRQRVVAAPAPAPPIPPQPAPAVQMAVPPPAAPQPTAPAVEVVQQLVDAPVRFTFVSAASVERATPDDFWEQYAAACAQEDKQSSPVDRVQQEMALQARVAALMQVLAPETPAMRLGLVKYLAAVSHAEATRALARLAVFSEEDEVRLAAVTALKVRRERDYTDILLASLRYPWPPVARRGADTLVKLERSDLVPQFVDVLDEPDPRAPVVKEENGQRLQQVRELVRVNHHRNCLLCHAPGNTAGVSGDTLTAAVPVPSDPLPSPSEGYQTTSPDLLVRIDVTYLRQDFSAFQAVADAHPWPEMQRFDFLVRTRTLAEGEAAAYRRELAAGDPGRPSPYHRAALAALRELTGRDAAPTAEAWRKLLNLPARVHQAALAK